MKKFVLAAAVFPLFSFAAYAADLPNTKGPPIFAPPPPAFSWTGLYAGLDGGYGWGDPTGYLLPDYPDLFGAAAAVAAGFIPSSLGVRQGGPFGGGQIGFNWQPNGPWVVGVETDIQGSGISGSSTTIFPGGGAAGPSTTTASDRLEWFGTARVRAGWLVLPNVLLYGTGGAAYGTERSAYYLAGPLPNVFAGSTADTRVGWTAGAGVEWKFTNNISFKAEYLHMDLGGVTVRGTDPLGAFPGTFFDYRFHNSYDLVRGGLNYDFDLSAPPGAVAAKY